MRARGFAADREACRAEARCCLRARARAPPLRNRPDRPDRDAPAQAGSRATRRRGRSCRRSAPAPGRAGRWRRSTSRRRGYGETRRAAISERSTRSSSLPPGPSMLIVSARGDFGASGNAPSPWRRRARISGIVSPTGSALSRAMISSLSVLVSAGIAAGSSRAGSMVNDGMNIEAGVGLEPTWRSRFYSGRPTRESPALGPDVLLSSSA